MASRTAGMTKQELMDGRRVSLFVLFFQNRIKLFEKCGLLANFDQNHEIYADTTDMAIFFD